MLFITSHIDCMSMGDKREADSLFTCYIGFLGIEDILLKCVTYIHVKHSQTAGIRVILQRPRGILTEQGRLHAHEGQRGL